MAFEKVNGGQSQFSLLVEINRLDRLTGSSRFDLDKDNAETFTTDQIHLSLRRSITSNEDLDPLLGKISCGGALTPISKPFVPKRSNDPALSGLMPRQAMSVPHSK